MRRLLAALFLPAALLANPGLVVSSSFPQLSAHATVRQVELDPAGGIYVRGDFTAADGRPRPGLARLNPDGTVDEEFEPEVIEWLNEERDTLLTIPLWISASAPPGSPGLFALSGGRLIVTGASGWDLLDEKGHGGRPGFSDLPRSGVFLQPQFEAEGRVFVIAEGELRAYYGDTLERDHDFALAAHSGVLSQAVAAADGKIWVMRWELGQLAPGWLWPNTPTYTLRRAEAGGSWDEGFAARNLADGCVHSVEAAGAGSFRVVSEWVERFRYTPTPSHRAFTAMTFDAEGGELGTVTYSVPLAWGQDQAVHQGADRVIHPTYQGARALIRTIQAALNPDPAFSVRFAVPEFPVAGPTEFQTLTALSDGSFLVGGTRKFLHDGSPDPGWHVARLSRRGSVSQLVALQDRTVLVVGDFDLADGVTAPGALVLRPDQSRDLSFSSSFDFRLVRKVLTTPNGGLVGLLQPGSEDVAGNPISLGWFDAAGEFTSAWPTPPEPDKPSVYFGSPSDIGVQSDGTILATFASNSDVISYHLRKIPAGGGTSSWLHLGHSSVSDSVLVLPDDSYLVGPQHFTRFGMIRASVPDSPFARPHTRLPDGSVIFATAWSAMVRRWHPETGVDAGLFAPIESAVGIRGAGPASDGKWFVWGNAPAELSLVRLHSNGGVDPTFRPPAGSVSAMLKEPGGTVLVAGDFAAGALLRLADTRVSGYDDWIAAATAGTGWSGEDLATHADPDGDGTENFLEYAASTDPTRSDFRRSQPSRMTSGAWLLPVNPEAPEIVRRVEISTDLKYWHPADASRVRLETSAAGFAWSLLPSHGNLFTRVRAE